MQGGDDLDADALARAMNIWDHAANDAAYHAERLARVGVHKSIVNRMIEPYLHINVVMTSCEPGLMNFFGLRLDKAAQPEIRVLAERMWAVWRESEPKVLQPGQWHLPFVHHMEDMGKSEKYNFYQNSTDILKDYYFSVATRVSAARCARISYLSFETGRPSTIEEDLRLFDRLAGSQPMHLSPLEHQATPDFWIKQPIAGPTAAEWNTVHAWANPHQHGNTPGWIQHRKMIPGEAVAALPEEYTR
jgi:thymidylate synthase ThyX